MPFHVPDPYSTAIRAPIGITYTVDAARGGVAVTGATGMMPSGGSITDTTKPGVRRVLTLELPGDQAMFNLLAPLGTTLTAKAIVAYTNRDTTTIPMGLFDVDSQTLSEGGGKLTLTAPDKWQRLIRSKFLQPTNSATRTSAVSQITTLVQNALGTAETVNVLTQSPALVGALTWREGTDVGAAIIQVATSAGLWCYFDRYGAFTIADQPTLGKSADWLIDASTLGVLVSLDRSRSRANMFNVVSVTSSAASSTAAFSPVWVWDNDPTSPTYAGPNDGTGKPDPTKAGPAGQSVYNLNDPNITTSADATVAGKAVLAKTVGLASQVSLTMTPNPALDAWDVLDVLPPGPVAIAPMYSGGQVGTATVGTATTGQVSGVRLYPSGRITERHTVDTVTHPLDIKQATQIQGRSTRTATYT